MFCGSVEQESAAEIVPKKFPLENMLGGNGNFPPSHFPRLNDVQQSCASYKIGLGGKHSFYVNEDFHGEWNEWKREKVDVLAERRRERKCYTRKKSSTIYDEDYVKILLSSHYFSVS